MEPVFHQPGQTESILRERLYLVLDKNVIGMDQDVFQSPRVRYSGFLAYAVALWVLAACSTVPKHSHTLSAAQAAYIQWTAEPEDEMASRAYHRSLAQLVEWFAALSTDRRIAACREAGLEIEIDSFPGTDPRHFIVADRVPRGRLKHVYKRPGVGVPVVAWRPNDGSDRRDALRPPEGLTRPATAVLDRAPSGQWRLRLLSPDRHEAVTLAGRERPLAADFTASIAVIVRRAEALRRSAFSGMLNSAASVRREKLYLIDPYDPKRIPLLMVHGLQSTPVSFANLSNDLAADPEIRRRYQIWHYHYPTGTPVLLNAATFRHVLKRTLGEIDPEGNDFATNNLVVIGHSMGGILTHTLTCNSGYKLWDNVIAARPETLPATPSSEVTVNDVFLFQRETRVRRVIFICVPHRGSVLADNWIGDLGQGLFRGDVRVTEAFVPLMSGHRSKIAPFLARLLDEKKLSSIRTLSGRSPALMALAEIPPAVPFHSIIGQVRPGPAYRGSDGVVAYPSSHLDGAESELIVRHGHEAFQHPVAVAEIKRILRNHSENARQ